MRDASQGSGLMQSRGEESSKGQKGWVRARSERGGGRKAGRERREKKIDKPEEP